MTDQLHVQDLGSCGLPQPFHCTHRRQGIGASWVRASGELDMLSAPELAQVLDDALWQSRLVLLDLNDIEFADSSGVHVIEDASVAALIDGRRLVVALAPAAVKRLFALARTAATVEFLGAGDDAPH